MIPGGRLSADAAIVETECGVPILTALRDILPNSLVFSGPEARAVKHPGNFGLLPTVVRSAAFFAGGEDRTLSLTASVLCLVLELRAVPRGRVLRDQRGGDPAQWANCLLPRLLLLSAFGFFCRSPARPACPKGSEGPCGPELGGADRTLPEALCRPSQAPVLQPTQPCTVRQLGAGQRPPGLRPARWSTKSHGKIPGGQASEARVGVLNGLNGSVRAIGAPSCLPACAISCVSCSPMHAMASCPPVENGA